MLTPSLTHHLSIIPDFRQACQALIGWLETTRRIDDFERRIWQADLHGGILERHCDHAGELRLMPGDDLYDEDVRFRRHLDEALARLGSLVEKPASLAPSLHKFRKSGDSFDKEDAYATIADLRSLMNDLGWSWYVVSGTGLGRREHSG